MSEGGTETMDKLRCVRKTRFIVTSLLLTLAVGCLKPYTPWPMSAQQIDASKTRLGTIGITGARHLPQLKVQTPSKGAMHGALDGAAVGALVPIEVSFGVIPTTCSSIYCLFIPAAGLALAPVGAAVGLVGGALTADSAGKVAERSAKINDAFAQLRMQERMRDEFTARLSDVKTFPFTSAQETGPATDGEKPDYRQFQSSGIGSINEIDVRKVTLVGTGKVRPQLHVELEVQSRLVSTTDNAELYCKVFTCSSDADTFEVWAAQDAKKFREVIEACYRDVANWSVADLYERDAVTPAQLETQAPRGTITISTAKCRQPSAERNP